MTGGTGFLGKNFVDFVQKHGGTIIGVGSQYNLANEESAERMFQMIDKNVFDYIIHGAALTAAGEWPAKHRAEQYDTNIRIHTNTLKMWHRYQPQAKMIGIGSSCTYPGMKEFFDESEYWNGQMHESVEVFGFTKKAVSIGIEAYKSQYGLRGTTLIPATLYGPHDHFDPEKSHVVSALIQKFVNAQKNNLPSVEVWGDGSQTREILYVEDQIMGLCTVLDFDGPILNVGSGIPVTIKKLAETIKDVSGYQGVIDYNASKFVGNKNKVMDIGLAKALYGWTTEVKVGNLRERLDKTVNWYKTNHTYV